MILLFKFGFDDVVIFWLEGFIWICWLKIGCIFLIVFGGIIGWDGWGLFIGGLGKNDCIVEVIGIEEIGWEFELLGIIFL